jgi:hypothetical protein
LPRKCLEIDQACAALVLDLKQRGLLDSTLVVWGGEFGRTPMNEARGGSKFLGRDHHPHCFTMWMADAGIKKGYTHGATDELLLFAAAVLCVIAPSVRAQVPTTYRVFKATASIPGSFQDSTNHLQKVTLTTKMLINIALDRDVSTPIDPNVILGYAFDFVALGQHNPPNPNGKAQLVVFQVVPGDFNAGTKLKTIGTIGGRTLVENQVFNKFRRVLTSQATIANTGGANCTFTAGNLVGGGTATRKPNSQAAATPETLTITAPSTVAGFIELTYTNQGQTVIDDRLLVISKGAVVAKGKVLGTFSEL